MTSSKAVRSSISSATKQSPPIRSLIKSLFSLAFIFLPFLSTATDFCRQITSAGAAKPHFAQNRISAAVARHHHLRITLYYNPDAFFDFVTAFLRFFHYFVKILLVCFDSQFLHHEIDVCTFYARNLLFLSFFQMPF